MPARFRDCGLSECQSVRFRRRFGRPRQLDAEERVWLVGEGLTGRAAFQINGNYLGTHSGDMGAFAFPVIEPLSERNELTVEIREGSPDAGLWGEIAIEIRRRAFLSRLGVEPAAVSRLKVTGEIVGDADGTFDLYLLVDGHTEAYISHGKGRFQLTTDELEGPPPPRVRVEMVQGAVVWWVAEIDVRPP